MKRIAGIFLIAMIGGAVSLGLYKTFEKKQSYFINRPEGIPISNVLLLPDSPQPRRQNGLFEINKGKHFKTGFAPK